MATFEQYSEKYQTIRMERREGILQITFHTDGDTLQWGALPHGEFPRAFIDIGSDPDNRVVIMTGTGDGFSGPRATPQSGPRRTARQWDSTYWEGKQLLTNLLNIKVPIISAVNGPALRHAQIPPDLRHRAGLRCRTCWATGWRWRGPGSGQDLLPRAWQLAEQLAQQPPLVTRYSRVALTQYLKRQMQDMLGYGLALEGVGAVDVS